MTDSTPPLVDVIAEALAAHRPNVTVEWCGAEGCEWNLPWGTVSPTERRDAQTAHQARAVLDALTKAGGVEVVTGYGVKLKSGDVERCGANAQDAKDWLEDFAGGDDPDYEPAEVVTRTTTTITIRTSWTAVNE